MAIQKPKEHRVRVKHFGVLNKDDARAVELSKEIRHYGWRKEYAHWQVAHSIQKLMAAAASGGFPDLKVVSCLRPSKKISEEEWIRQIREKDATRVGKAKKYFKDGLTEKEQLRRLYRYRAYSSPHETGLAVDFTGHGMGTSSGKVSVYEKLPIYEWLVLNAGEIGGFTPYHAEPWHWEANIGKKAWQSLPDGSVADIDHYAQRAASFGNISRSDSYQGAKSPSSVIPQKPQAVKYTLDQYKEVGRLFNFDTGLWS